jgi:hypothetical protein
MSDHLRWIFRHRSLVGWYFLNVIIVQPLDFEMKIHVSWWLAQTVLLMFLQRIFHVHCEQTPHCCCRQLQFKSQRSVNSVFLYDEKEVSNSQVNKMLRLEKRILWQSHLHTIRVNILHQRNFEDFFSCVVLSHLCQEMTLEQRKTRLSVLIQNTIITLTGYCKSFH